MEELIKKFGARIKKHLKHHAKKVYHHTRDHFIPHAGNNYHPHVLKHRVLIGYSVILVLLKVLVIVVPIALPSSSLYSSSITPQNIIDLTNQTRENLGLNKLVVNEKLMQAARAKAEDMIENQYFAHTSPAGVTPWEWVKGAGYNYIYAGENLAVHFSSAESVHEGWLASPSHRANIVNSHYTEIGVGTVLGEFEGVDSTLVVQYFGQPLVTTKQVSVTAPVQKNPVSAPPLVVSVNKPVSQVAGTAEAPKVIQPVVLPKTVPVSQPEPTPIVTQTTNQANIPVTIPPTEPTPLVEGSISVIKKSPEEIKQLIPQALPPIIYESSFKAKPEDNNYSVSLVVTGADSVTVQLAGEWTELKRDSNSNLWFGSVPYNMAVLNLTGDQLSVTARNVSGGSASKVLAWVAPKIQTQQFYTFNESSNKFAKFFGFIKVGNLDDSVSQFYLYVVVFLAAALLINVFVKIRIQHASVICHTLLVIGLALFLFIV